MLTRRRPVFRSAATGAGWLTLIRGSAAIIRFVHLFRMKQRKIWKISWNKGLKRSIMPDSLDKDAKR
jgi:hypothetical protein